jgi:hypothetical protein
MAVVYWQRDRTLAVGEGKGYAHLCKKTVIKLGVYNVIVIAPISLSRNFVLI